MPGITGYNIYRAGGTSGGVFLNNTFSFLADVEDDIFDYEDDNADFTYGSNFVTLYHVKAENSSSESSATNTVVFHYNMSWSNSLVLYPSTSNNPVLAWQKHPTMNNVSSYKIYRAVTSAGALPPSPLLYSLVASVN